LVHSILPLGDCSPRTYGRPPCTPNAECNNDNICQCQEKYIPTPNNKCLLGYDQECDTTDKICHPSFVCRNPPSSTATKCLCADGQIEKNGFCFALADSQCSNLIPCIDNSNCNGNPQQCMCSPEYKKSAEGYCLGLHGASCANTPEYLKCHPEEYLECTGGNTCACAAGYQHWPENNVCQGHVGSACRTNDYCLPASHCNDTSSTCICNEGYEHSGNDAACKGGHGSVCSSRILCNDRKFLDCIENVDADDTCGCTEGRVYHQPDSVCVALVDSECGDLNPEANVTLGCIDNAFCNTVDSSNGTCVCNTGYVPDGQGGCQLTTVPTTEPTEDDTTESTDAPIPTTTPSGVSKNSVLSGFLFAFVVFCIWL